jgi:hypothetical protein
MRLQAHASYTTALPGRALLPARDAREARIALPDTRE